MRRSISVADPIPLRGGVIDGNVRLRRMMSTLRESYRLYQHLILPGRYQIRRFIRSCISRLSARLCADVGAGTSPYRPDLERTGSIDYYISFDIAPSDNTMVCADCCRLPLRDSSVDLVVAFDIITCVPDPEGMLTEAARVLAPGGHLMLTYTFLFGESGVHDFRRWTLEGMNQELSASGFSVVAHEKRGGFFFALTKLCESLVINCVPGNRMSWRAGNGLSAFARVGITAVLLLPLQGIGWIAMLIDHVLPFSPIYFGGMVMAKRLPSYLDNPGA
jgi:SAM-dependent methyltransferase